MKKLIQLITKNPLISVNELAKLCGKSERTVEQEIEELKKKGIILGFQALINKEKTNGNEVTAIIEVKIQPERDGGFDRIARRMYNFPEVVSCHLVSGDYDLLLFVKGKTLQDVARFVAEKLSTLEKVQGTQTHFMLKTYKENNIILEHREKLKRLSVSP